MGPTLEKKNTFKGDILHYKYCIEWLEVQINFMLVDIDMS